ncbi:MAG: putative drug exporter of the superfamily [Gaiellales bacterium]|nr:putative drug exporter of the superfamily [Gaiellales bacterium]
MSAVTRWALNHKLVVVGLWLCLTAAGAFAATSVGNNLTKGLPIPGQPAYEANLKMLRTFGISGQQQPTIAVLHLPASLSMGTTAGRTAAARTFAAGSKAGPVAILDYATTHDKRLVSADGRTAFAIYDMPSPDISRTAGTAGKILPALEAQAPAGATVVLTGYDQLSAGSTGGGGSGPSVLVETLIGAAGALIVLTFVFASAVAVMPLLIAVVTILTTFLLVSGMTHLTSVSFIIQFLVALVGLGIAVDYSLLIVTRWREERERGLSNEDAIMAAGATAGHAVVLSGLTVAIGLLSLVVLPVPFLRSLGVGGMLIPLVAIAVAITLLPIMLSSWGPALDRHRLRRSSTTYSRGWERWGRMVVRRKWLAGLAGAAIVVALAIPALSLNSARPSTRALAQAGTAHDALVTLEKAGVPSGVVYPFQVLTHKGSASAALAKIRATPGVWAAYAPSAPHFRNGADALITVVPTAEGNTSAGKAMYPRLRSSLAGLPAEVGGSTAQDIDFYNAVYGNFPLMLGLIALVTFVLLARAFRSPILALKAVVLNIFSLGAAYGLMVLVWQKGYGSNLIWGVPATHSIREFVPILVFAFLFGLSMDYEVFVLSRMREEYDTTHSTDQAVVNALSRTGRLVTSAAIILCISFASITLTPDVDIRVLAFGLAAGILFDATVIRSLLVPALVALMGHWNWWMPTGLERALRIPRQPRPPQLEAAAVTKDAGA